MCDLIFASQYLSVKRRMDHLHYTEEIIKDQRGGVTQPKFNSSSVITL